MAPVERIKWMTSTRDCTLGHGCVHWASRLTIWTALVSMSSLWSFSGQFSLAVSTSHPISLPTPPTLAQNWCAPSKNDLKWPKIKQVTNSKLYYIKFNRSISTVLLNKAGLSRAKAGYTDYNFKMGIITRCKLGRLSRARSHILYTLLQYSAN